MKKRAKRGALEPQVTENGDKRYRIVQLVLVEIKGEAPDLQTFSAMAEHTALDYWLPIEFGPQEVQIACQDGYWHPIDLDLWGEMPRYERREPVTMTGYLLLKPDQYAYRDA